MGNKVLRVSPSLVRRRARAYSRLNSLRTLLVATCCCGLVASGWAQPVPHEPQVIDFSKVGRPADAFTLSYSRDDATCGVFLGAMNEPRPKLPNDGAYSYYRRMGNDLFLGSRLTVDWTRKEPGNAWYTQVDLDNDAKPDHVYHLSWSIRGREHDAMHVTSTPPVDPLDPDQSRIEALRDEDSGIVLDNRTVDFGGGAIVTDRSGWNFGEYWNIAKIEQRAYITTGGNWTRLAGRNWFPVRLIEMETHARFKVMCELTPKYRQDWVDQ